MNPASHKSTLLLFVLLVMIDPRFPHPACLYLSPTLPFLWRSCEKCVLMHVTNHAMPITCTLLCRWRCFSHYGYRSSTWQGLLRPSACVTQHRITAAQWESLWSQALIQQTIFFFKTLCYTEGANKEGVHQKVGLFVYVAHVLWISSCGSVESL